MSNCHCPEDDMNDDRNWSEEECSICEELYDYGPNSMGTICPLCESKARKAAAKALPAPRATA